MTAAELGTKLAAVGANPMVVELSTAVYSLLERFVVAHEKLAKAAESAEDSYTHRVEVELHGVK